MHLNCLLYASSSSPRMSCSGVLLQSLPQQFEQAALQYRRDVLQEHLLLAWQPVMQPHDSRARSSGGVMNPRNGTGTSVQSRESQPHAVASTSLPNHLLHLQIGPVAVLPAGRARGRQEGRVEQPTFPDPVDSRHGVAATHGVSPGADTPPCLARSTRGLRQYCAVWSPGHFDRGELRPSSCSWPPRPSRPR